MEKSEFPAALARISHQAAIESREAWRTLRSMDFSKEQCVLETSSFSLCASLL